MLPLSVAPVTASSLADAKLDNAQRRLSFLWDAAHSPAVAQLCPSVSAGWLRSLRSLAFADDLALHAAHTQTSFCSQCCSIRLPGINTTARVEPSAAWRKAERNRRRRKENKQTKREARQKQDESATSSGSMNLTGSPTDRSDSDHSLVTPQKKRKRASLTQMDSATGLRSAAAAATAFVSPFAGRSALAASASAFSTPSLSSAALASSASGESSHSLVLHCLRCGHRDRIAGQSRKQRQMLQAAPDDLDSLSAQTEQGQSQLASEAAARDVFAKRQRTLQSLQGQQQQPQLAQPKLRTAMPSLEELALAQQRLQQARAATAAGSFFGEQVRDVAATAQRPASAAAAAPSPSPPPAPASSAPFSFSRSGTSSAASGSAKRPSLSSVLAQASSAGAAPPSSVFSSASMFAAAPAGSSSVLQGIRIAGGIQSTAAAASSSASKGFTFTKAGAGGAAKKR